MIYSDYFLVLTVNLYEWKHHKTTDVAFVIKRHTNDAKFEIQHTKNIMFYKCMFHRLELLSSIIFHVVLNTLWFT